MIRNMVAHAIVSMVKNPDQVTVLCDQDDDKTNVITIRVMEQDRGRVIGREGRTIRAIRRLIYALVPEGEKISVNLAE